MFVASVHFFQSSSASVHRFPFQKRLFKRSSLFSRYYSVLFSRGRATLHLVSVGSSVRPSVPPLARNIFVWRAVIALLPTVRDYLTVYLALFF